MWYVLQTMTGKEEELVRMIKKIVSPDLYTDCFIAYYERVWRKQQQSIVHVERLFPGYAFIIADDPAEVFLQLKRVPAMSKMIADGEFTFLPIEQEEEIFLENLLRDGHIVRLSYVATDGRGHAYRVSGPLEAYTSQVVRYQFKKRYVIIRLKLLGVEKTVALGIILNEDIQQEILYGKVEAPLKVPERYEPPQGSEELTFAVGDHVKVTSGSFENMSGVIWKIKKSTVEIGVRLFGQDMSMEVPIEFICRNFL